MNDYGSVVEAAHADDRVVGLILTGSRARGPFARDDSDWDLRLVARDDSLDEAAATYATERGARIETVVFSLTDFQHVAAIGSPTEWDRYSYAHAEVVIDKLDGRIGELVSEKGSLSWESAIPLAAGKLDEYVNSYYRSAKNLAIGLTIEGRLDAAESVAPFLTALFAMHGRVRPFNKFLGWELAQHPLPGSFADGDALLQHLHAVTSTADIAIQQRLFRQIEQLAREHDLGRMFDGWNPDLPKLRGQ